MKIKSVRRIAFDKFINEFRHINKKYYEGRMVRWLLEDKKGKGVYCNKCSNIANGIKKGTVLYMTYNIPLCGRHLEI